MSEYAHCYIPEKKWKHVVIPPSLVVQPDLVFPLFYAQALDLTLAKDERLAVGFFQRSAVMMQIDRYKAAHLAQSNPKSRLLCFYFQFEFTFEMFFLITAHLCPLAPVLLSL